MGRLILPLAVATSALALAACATGPAPSQPPPSASVVLPMQWSGPTRDEAQRVTADWWCSFGSAELDALIEQARQQSLDVAAASARLRQAQAAARAAGATLLPELQATLRAGRQGRLGGDAVVEGTRYAAGLNASYEVDFWGGRRAGRDSAAAALRAGEHDLDTVRLTLTAGVASGWLQAVALDERIAIARRSLDDARRVLDLVDSRTRAGAATPLELAQQRGLVASRERNLAALRQQAAEARITLAVLLGRPADLPLGTATLQALRIPQADAGLPSDLLRRRPDLARAEARLAAADADVEAARAALLPSLNLGAAVGTGGSGLGRVLQDPAYTLAAALAAPIFDGGRRAAGRDLAQARREELLAGYRQAVVAAFGDVQAALEAADALALQARAQDEELRQALRARDLAESRWRAGAETLLVLLDAQRVLHAAQDEAVQLRLARLQAAVSLYRALGGGWQAASP